jgi:proline dehydrogenase
VYSGAFDRLVAEAVPYVPQPIVRRLAQPYVAGQTITDAVRSVRELNAAGQQATVDVHGEAVTDAAKAAATAQAYVDTLDTIGREALGATVSLKPSALGSELSWDVAAGQMERVVRRVEELDLRPDFYEFQTLLGVRPDLARVLARDHTVRVYVPYGTDSYAYAQRRLRENPQIAGYVARDTLREVGRFAHLSK